VGLRGVCDSLTIGPMSFAGRWVWLLVASSSAGCVGITGPARFPVEHISVPDGSEIYTAEARPEGVTGGPGAEKVEAELLQILRSRGDKPQADGALGATASWALRETHEGRKFDLTAADAASRHFGFGGVLVISAVFDLNAQDTWRDGVTALPSNLSLSRYGIRVSPSGRSGALVLGSMEGRYEPIQRAFEPGQSVALKGEVGSRFQTAMVFLTKPDGKVDHKDAKGRSFGETFALAQPGTYRLEVMGNGKDGPVIVLNLPLYVGVPEPVAHGLVGEVVDPEEAEPRLLALLNQARQQAGARPLRPDPELRDIARAHSQDMVGHHFFAHVSPNSGTPEDRLRRSGALVSAFGENIGMGATPEQVHEGLLNSPGHRVNMLLPEYTHVGIAAEKSDSGLLVTMNFGRRPNPADVPTTTAQVEAAVADLRSKQGLRPFTPDPVYRGAAQAGADKLADGAEPKDVGQAIESGVAREVARLRSSRPNGCTRYLELLELEQLKTVPELFSPDLVRLGLATHVHQDKKGKRLATVFVLDGPLCKRQSP